MLKPPLTVSGVPKKTMPDSIPIKINKDFARLLEDGIQMTLEIKDNQMEIHANGEVLS